MIKFFLSLLLPLQLAAQPGPQQINSWVRQAKNVTIIRDHWGIPHIYGKKDADAVFGLLYAQCEDDFNRVEMNYIEKLGRLAEIKGPSFLYSDLLNRLVLDSAAAIRDYQQGPAWLRRLCNSFAAGINYYLYRHPEIKPRLLTHFEPWYPLLWTDGSIGAISTAGLNEKDLQELYGKGEPAFSLAPGRETEAAFSGSNGFAISPSVTKNGRAILYINPHVSFYFRAEAQMQSEEGLNTYGAVTWGQFFIYQGFNQNCGWMHTSSQADVSDAYIEKISGRPGHLFYQYDQQRRPVKVKKITLKYLEAGEKKVKNITALFTHHGPLMGYKNGQWLSVRSFNRSRTSLMQSWLRTKATGFLSFKKTLELRGNTSNNTVYADAKGNIAYWHGNYIPIRDPHYNWNQPVDGSSSKTEWRGLHTLGQIVHLVNPPNGWLQNCNSTPFTVAGPYSPRKKDYPAYMAPDGENFRGLNAVRVLAKEKSFTLEKVIQAGYDTYLSFFENLVPALLKAYDQLPPGDSMKTRLSDPANLLRSWDLHTGPGSAATTLAIFWAKYLPPTLFNAYIENNDERSQVQKLADYLARASSQELLLSFQQGADRLQQEWGSTNVEWGTLNRVQRLSNLEDPEFDDARPSFPIGFTSSAFGCLPSIRSKPFGDSKKWYGYSGNSFICAVEFGGKVKAKSLLAMGESGHPESVHFSDQAKMYSQGIFKEVLFYKDEVLQHAEKTYHPGQ